MFSNIIDNFSYLFMQNLKNFFLLYNNIRKFFYKGLIWKLFQLPIPDTF